MKASALDARLPGAVLLVIVLTSCVSRYEPIDTDPREYFESGPNRSRVTLPDGQQVVLVNPEIIGDSLSSGGEGRCRFDTETQRRICVRDKVALNDAALVEEVSTNLWLAIPLTVVAGAAGGFLGLLIAGGYGF